MDDNLQRLTRALRAERCPRSVLDQVQSRIARDHPSSRRVSGIAFTACIAALLMLLAVWPWLNYVSRSPSHSAVAGHADNVRVVQEAGAALGYIGTLLVEAGKHTHGAILNDAVPPLRNGIEAVSKTIKNKM